MVDVDSQFPKKWPFGIIKTAQWIGCLALLITLYCSPYYYGGTSFVFFCAWTIFLISLISWIAHLLGFHRRTFTMGQAAAFVPFALLDFIYSFVFFFLFCISALICLVSMFSSIGYAVSLFLVYLFSTVFCLFIAAMCGYLAVLLYRATPNGRILNLRSVIIEGDKTANFGPPTNVGAAPQMGGYPQGTNPV
uniref:MARVEL domain-containing protein n=1 Tax=Ascaris lumbricoides TaxID=6252 RepID=A0A0M3IR93_ASCLU